MVLLEPPPDGTAPLPRNRWGQRVPGPVRTSPDGPQRARPTTGPPPRTEPPRAEPPRAEPPRAEPPRAEPPRAEPGSVPKRPFDWPGAPPPRRHRPLRVLRRFVIALLLLQLALGGFVLTLRWWTPGRTAFMIESGGPTVYQYVSLDHVSRYLVAAVVAHEDQELGTRTGAFSVAQFGNRVAAYLSGAPDPSGSTIPQQLAKNLFLWPHQDPVRKGVESVIASEMALSLSDQRMVELYVNYAQFGPRLYGVCAASWYYFGEPPWDMTEYQSAQLMGVLPDPDRVTRAPGGGLDTGPTADPRAVELINGAANVHVPRELGGMGGWRAAVATVGLHDTAADHAAERGDPTACSAMPGSVAEIIRHP